MGRRFFRYGELPLVLLALIGDRSLGAYELMAELERVFAPHYRPSPGGVYPALRALLDEGLVDVDEKTGTASSYRLTSTGRANLRGRRDDLAAIESRTGRHLGVDDHLDGVLARVATRVRALAGRVPPEMVEDELHAAVERLEAAAAVRGGDAR